MIRHAATATALALATTLLVGGLVLAQDDVVNYTGCLDTEGALTNVASADEPVAPCDRTQELAQWNQEGTAGPQGDPGPQGEAGAQGEQGDKGKKGDPGTSATYFVNKDLSESVLVNGVIKCDEGDLVTGGGYRVLSGPPSTVIESYPSGQRAWTISMIATDGSMLPLEITIYAVCSDLEPLR
jgi:hypothetical protein